MEPFQAWTLGLAALSVLTSAATALGSQWFRERRERLVRRERDRERWLDDRKRMYAEYFERREEVATCKAQVARSQNAGEHNDALRDALRRLSATVGRIWFIGSDAAMTAIHSHEAALWEAVTVARKLAGTSGAERDALWQEYRKANGVEGDAWLTAREVLRADIRADVD